MGKHIYDAVLFCLLLSLLREPARNRMMKEGRIERGKTHGQVADRPVFIFQLYSYWLVGCKCETDPLCFPRCSVESMIIILRGCGDNGVTYAKYPAQGRCSRMLLYFLLPYVHLVNHSSFRLTQQISYLPVLKTLLLSWKYRSWTASGERWWKNVFHQGF